MNITTGGPHILFFERDQQLTAILLSEFQLAGYECHTTRTAVEVFDAIARYPVRMVLVNLAQAAASRREFWVALDTQRRGRGVQVLTYRCANIASYSARDSDERSQAIPADIDVDGMLGLMSMVDIVRARVPGVGSSTNAMSRLARTGGGAPDSIPPSPLAAPAPTESLATPSASQAHTHTVRAELATDTLGSQPRVRAISGYQGQTTPIQAMSSTAQPPHVTSSIPTSNAGGNTQSYSEKIRAVLYPQQRSANTHGRPSSNGITSQSAQAETHQSPPQEMPRYAYGTQSAHEDQQDSGVSSMSPASDAPILQRLANGTVGTANANASPGEQREPGLAQLSRMVQAHASSFPEASSLLSEQRVEYTPLVTTAPQKIEPMSTQPLRASPIERRASGLSGQSGVDGPGRTDAMAKTDGQSAIGQTGVVPVTPLASIATLMPTAPSQPATPTPPMSSQVSNPQLEEYAQYSEYKEYPTTVRGPENEDAGDNDSGEPTADLPRVGRADTSNGNGHINTRVEQQTSLATPASTQDEESQSSTTEEGVTQNNAVLMDIIQSLPPMSSPVQSIQSSQVPQQPQAQVLSGRTMRSLGNVLLEGHLVPQDRLEVAQNIQRMLRGVDLNYQLGEILLMFKLLTPDQLLAASLVSYGLITTQQISALGRIRQELHSIGLDYDLESLLLLFRMLTPEQLRQVRASWRDN